MDREMKEHLFMKLDTGGIYELEYRKYLLKGKGGKLTEAALSISE
jgi:hypothetical protein